MAKERRRVKDKRILVSLGGGFSSTALMPRVLLRQYPLDQLHFVNAVLPNEHPDTWRLMDAVEEKLGISVVYIAYHPESGWQYVSKSDRSNKDKLFTPFDLFDHVHYVGNKRVDKCSQFLKRMTILKYVKDTFPKDDKPLIAIGIGKEEFERASAIKRNWQDRGYDLLFPLEHLEELPVEDQQKLMMEWYGVSLELYDLGFIHNNCRGACIKAGLRQWAKLWHTFPQVYEEWELREQQWIVNHNGRRYPFLYKNVNYERIFITLQEFRLMLEQMMENKEVNYITKEIDKLPHNPACMWCSAI